MWFQAVSFLIFLHCCTVVHHMFIFSTLEILVGYCSYLPISPSYPFPMAWFSHVFRLNPLKPAETASFTLGITKSKSLGPMRRLLRKRRQPISRASDPASGCFGIPGMVRAGVLLDAGCCWCGMMKTLQSLQHSSWMFLLFLTLQKITSWQNFILSIHWVSWWFMAVLHALHGGNVSVKPCFSKTCGLSWKLQDRRGRTPGDKLHQIAWLIVQNVDIMWIWSWKYPGYVALGASNSLNFKSGRYADSGLPNMETCPFLSLHLARQRPKNSSTVMIKALQGKASQKRLVFFGGAQ